MLRDSDKRKFIDAYSYVKRSDNRQTIIKLIAESGEITPKDLVNEMDVRFSLVSRTLGELKDHDIVECLNEYEKVGRLYTLTEIGQAINEKLILK